jgi:hypothetical protein
MKPVVATLLLLFQLQPLAGSVACLFSSERADKQECEMPDQPGAPVASVLESASAGQECALALACARSALAVPSFSQGQESDIPLHSSAALVSAVTLKGVASSPPFHPPRV